MDEEERVSEEGEDASEAVGVERLAGGLLGAYGDLQAGSGDRG